MGRRRDRTTRRDEPLRVLVVADDPVAASLLTRILGVAGHRVAVVGEHNEAIITIAKDPPDLAVLDLSLGGPGGNLKLLQALRGHPDDEVFATRVLLLGSKGASRLFSWESGVDGVLMRPFHASALLAEVEAIVNRPEEERRSHRRRQRDLAIARNGDALGSPT